MAGCKEKAPISSEAVYTNNYFIPGAGYYHAPFRAWYPLPYNDFNPLTKTYFHGGQWSAEPFDSVTNISMPTPEAARQAEVVRTDVTRGGFGRSSGSHYWGGS